MKIIHNDGFTYDELLSFKVTYMYNFILQVTRMHPPPPPPPLIPLSLEAQADFGFFKVLNKK